MSTQSKPSGTDWSAYWARQNRAARWQVLKKRLFSLFIVALGIVLVFGGYWLWTTGLNIINPGRFP